METSYELLKVVGLTIGTLLAAPILAEKLAKSPVTHSAPRKLDAALRMPKPYRSQMARWSPYVFCPGGAVFAMVGFALGVVFWREMLKALAVGRIQAGAALAVGSLFYAVFAAFSIGASLRALNAIRHPHRRTAGGRR